MDRSEEEALRDGFAKIDELCRALELPTETQETAEGIYEDAVTADHVTLVGRGVDAVASSTVLLACRQTGEVRTSDEIASQTSDHIEAKRLHKTTKYLCAKLDLGLVVADPRDFVDRISEKLDADDEDVELAKRVVDVVKDEGIAVNQPANSVAATSFYYVGAHDRGHGRYTQNEVADAVDVSPLTVRNNYREYSDVLDQYSISELKAQPA